MKDIRRVKAAPLLAACTLFLAACSAEATPAAAPPAPVATAFVNAVTVSFATPEATAPLPTATVDTAGSAPAATALLNNPTAEVTAQATAAPTAATVLTPQPATPVAVQLTQGGCCVQPFFTQDGAQVVFLDRPSGAQAAGFYAVPVDQPLAAPQLYRERIGSYSRDMSHVAVLLNGQTFVERTDGQAWRINNSGRFVSFAPDASVILWQVSEEVGGFDRRRSEIWIANVDGTDARRVATRFGGGALAWFPDGKRVLLGGRANRDDPAPTLTVLDLQDGGVRDLVTIERLRGTVISPDGKRLIYFVAQARQEGIGGTFLLNLEEAEPAPVKLDFFGAYRWRDADRLLFVPLRADLVTPSNELWQLDVNTLVSEKLIASAEASPFKIGNGDWDVSFDGKRILWVNARDRNIWMQALP